MLLIFSFYVDPLKGISPCSISYLFHSFNEILNFYFIFFKFYQFHKKKKNRILICVLHIKLFLATIYQLYNHVAIFIIPQVAYTQWYHRIQDPIYFPIELSKPNYNHISVMYYHYEIIYLQAKKSIFFFF